MDDPKVRELCETTEAATARVQGAQQRLIGDGTAAHLAQTFKALSDPTRLRIISALLHDELCVHELSQAVGASQSAVSHQLSTLRQMRLVRFRREGRHVFYSLDDEHIYDLFRQGLEHVSHQ